MVVVTEHEDLNHKYDVFLSFRGADTRNGFTDHLYNTLLDAGITTFLDDEEIETGEPLKPELESAIKSSRASIIVLSTNYATSTWCLDELVLILEQKMKSNQIVIPIFYHVEPTHVRYQESSFGEAMAKKHKERMEAETDAEKRSQLALKMESWKMALKQVADLKGKAVNGRKETKLIEEIVTDIHRRIGVPLCHTLPSLTGRNYDIRFITSWLTDGSCHTIDILTIVGISGIGKTSLAKYVFRLHDSKFRKSSFIEDINTRCKEHHNGLLDLQKQLHGDISKKIELHVNDVTVYTSKIENVLSHKRVFVVLDDIGSLDQLNALLGKNGLHPGSKIIITTKDASLTERCALFKTQVHPKHTKVLLDGLNEYESLKILCMHAFESHTPKEGYKNVSKELVKYCDGHPLGLELMGASLHKRDVAYWEDFIKRLKKEPLYGIEKLKKALHISFESLNSDNDKELFKHIACFFVGEDINLTNTILETCDIFTSGITNLMEKCFLSLGWNNQLMMHSLIQEMGRDLVRQESPNNPGERSRLWCHEESFNVLRRKKGTKSILALALDMRMLDKKKLCGSFELKTDSFCQMDNVMLLQLNYVQLSECFESFPEELRWLSMHGFPLKSIHLDRPLEYLVCLDMSYSNIEFFDMSYSNPQPPAKRQKKLVGSCSNDKRLLGSLKILDLSFCDQLHNVGGFFELPALEKLTARKCRNLIEVCESVEQCVELVDIDLSYCCKLKKLPISLHKLKKVQTLVLDGCNLCESTIINSSDISINPQTSPSSIRVEAIPSDIKFFMTLLPSSLRILSLADANLSNESFPMDLSSLAMLEELRLDGNPIVSLPSCVRTLPRIEKLSIDECYDVIFVEHLPRTLRVFSMFTEDCVCDTRKIRFDPEMPPLKLEGIPWFTSHPSLEFEGIIKIQPMADVEEKLLHSLGWKKSDFIKEGHLENHNIQMVYEFGIFSTLYWGKGMPEWIGCRSDGPSISFIIPSSSKKLRGLNFCYVKWPPYITPSMGIPDIIIRNITKTQTWIYSHFTDTVDCYSWLSHWMFGPNEMEAGDHIIIECECRMKCGVGVGVGVVYDDGSMEEGEDVLSYYKSWNHIIGGDLSAFQATTGEYYLCRTFFTRDYGKFDAPFIGEEGSYKVYFFRKGSDV